MANNFINDKTCYICNRKMSEDEKKGRVWPDIILIEGYICGREECWLAREKREQEPKYDWTNGGCNVDQGPDHWSRQRRWK